jgi:hypothetical protein
MVLNAEALIALARKQSRIRMKLESPGRQNRGFCFDPSRRVCGRAEKAGGSPGRAICLQQGRWSNDDECIYATPRVFKYSHPFRTFKPGCRTSAQRKICGLFFDLSPRNVKRSGVGRKWPAPCRAVKALGEAPAAAAVRLLRLINFRSTIMGNEIYKAVENVATLSKRDALVLADEIIDDMIVTLQRDRTLPARSFAQWSLTLADLRARVAERIAGEIEGHVDLGAVLLDIEAIAGWEWSDA